MYQGLAGPEERMKRGQQSEWGQQGCMLTVNNAGGRMDYVNTSGRWSEKKLKAHPIG